MARAARSDSPKPVVGVTGNARAWSPSWWCIRLSLLLAGAKPVRISVNHPSKPEHLDALVISGGDDIQPTLYGEEPNPKTLYDPARDELEQLFIRYAFQTGLPMLGICRGYQLMNVVAGGALFTDIRKLRKRTSNRTTVLPRKSARIAEDGLLHSLLGKQRLRINSLHFQAVKEVGQGFTPVVWDLDRFVQGVEHQTQPWLGVQWHPEYLFYRKDHLGLFKWLVAAAKAGSAAGSSVGRQDAQPELASQGSGKALTEKQGDQA